MTDAQAQAEADPILMRRLVMALWLPEDAGRPYAQVSPEQMRAALLRAGFSPHDADRAVTALVKELDLAMRNA